MSLINLEAHVAQFQSNVMFKWDHSTTKIIKEKFHSWVSWRPLKGPPIHRPHHYFFPSSSFFFFFFVVWTTFKVLYEICYNIASVLAFWHWGTCDLSFLTKYQTHTPCIGRWRPKHWTTREVWAPLFLKLLANTTFSHLSLYPHDFIIYIKLASLE